METQEVRQFRQFEDQSAFDVEFLSLVGGMALGIDEVSPVQDISADERIARRERGDAVLEVLDERAAHLAPIVEDQIAAEVDAGFVAHYAQFKAHQLNEARMHEMMDGGLFGEDASSNVVSITTARGKKKTNGKKNKKKNLGQTDSPAKAAA